MQIPRIDETVSPYAIRKYVRHAVRATIRDMYGATPYEHTVSVEAERVLNELLPVVKAWHSPRALFGFERGGVNVFRRTVIKAIRLARAQALEQARPVELSGYLKPIPFDC